MIQTTLKLGWNMLNRDRRSGELRLLLISLIVAVAAMTSVGFFIDRLRAALERDAAQLLGADLILNATDPVSESFRNEARTRGLSLAEVVSFSSMALGTKVTSPSESAADEPPPTQLASVKAVSSGYPLRGKLRIAATVGGADMETSDVPAPGTVWVDAALLPPLNAHVGGPVQLGEKQFIVSRVITLEPDRGFSFANLAPRVLLNMADLPATQLIQNGSRISYRQMFAGSAEAIRAYRNWLQPQLKRGQRLEGLEGGQQQVRVTLDRAEQFLSLVALLTAMLAAVAVALAARRFMQRHLDGCAVMRCLGISQGQLLGLYLVEFALIGLVGATLGVVLGYAAHFVFVELMGSLPAMSSSLQGKLPQPTLLPALQGFMLGFVLLIGFALPPVVQLRHVPPVRVLRRDVGLPRASTTLGYVGGIGLFAFLLIWSARNLQVGLLTAGGFALAFGLFALITWLLLRLLAVLRPRLKLNPSWRFALAAIERRPVAVIVQTLALAIGLMALLLLSVTRTDLVSAWKKSASPDAPNRFIINIQPEQREAFREQLRAARLGDYDFSPMVRGRLVRINDQPLGDRFANTVMEQGNPDAGRNDAEPAKNGEASSPQRQAVNREYNLSYMAALPGYNHVSTGQWFAPDARDEVSVEEGVAKTLGIKLGDRLNFDVGGAQTEARVTSLRKLEWDSMHVNFFFIFAPAALEQMSQTWIAAFHLPPAQTELGNKLVSLFPNITVIDTGAILQQVQDILDQVVSAIEFLFLFTLIAGLLVLYAALLSSRDERTREAALLRALGASRQQLSRAQRAEFISVGVLAGLLAAAGAVAVGYVLATRAFDFPYGFSIAPWLLGAGGGVAIALIGGWLGLRPVLNQPPLATLRDV